MATPAPPSDEIARIAALSRYRILDTLPDIAFDDLAHLAAATDPLTEKLETLSLKPSKSNIAIKLVALAWVPHWRAADGTSLPAWS